MKKKNTGDCSCDHNIKAAIKSYELAIALNNYDDVNVNNLLNCYEDIGQYPKVIECFIKRQQNDQLIDQ